MRIVSSRVRSRRGVVLVLLGLMGVAMIGAVGLAVDMGRMFIAKNESQNFSDSAALAAALQLNGTLAGITAANNAAAATRGTWNLGSQNITGYTVEYATSKDGPWSQNPGTGTAYTHARVTTPLSLPLYFLPIITSVSSQAINTQAVAGQLPQTNLSRGLEPYTVVVQQSYPSVEAARLDNFGLVVGSEYDIQWPQFNGNRHGCTDGNPDKCFNSPVCAAESKYAQVAVKNHWGSSRNGYWGSNSNSVIYQEVMNGTQLQAVSIGDYLFMTNGNKQSQASALDARVAQDGSPLTNDIDTYRADPLHNGRRLLAIPVVLPTALGTQVWGYVAMYLISNGSPSNDYWNGTGNDPFCAQYAGPYVFSGDDKGGSTGGGAFKVALVQ